MPPDSPFDVGWHDAHALLAARVRRASRPLRTPSDLAPLVDHVGDARFVLLGEATHGTSEFYTGRAEITCRLIEERGFSFVAVEDDWPDCYRVNRYVERLDKAPTGAIDALHAFERWPTWMWGNQETAFIVEWLREHNLGAQRTRSASTAWTSTRCGTRCAPWWRTSSASIRQRRATALVPTSCADEAVAMLSALRRNASAYREDGADAFFEAEQNALVARNAERYYRAMVRGDEESWNVRDRHMVETLERLAAHHGPDAKAVVWAHNTHVGDARYTDMREAGTVNVGQLLREAHGEDAVAIVGFGTHRGHVIAGEGWGAPMRRMTVPAARPGSWEDVLHRAAHGRDFFLLFNGDEDGGIARLDQWLDHRAIGVVYRLQHEHYGNYVPTQVPRRYDAFVYVDESHAVVPLRMPVVEGEMEGYPTGM